MNTSTSFVVTAALTLSLVGCGGGSDGGDAAPAAVQGAPEPVMEKVETAEKTVAEIAEAAAEPVDEVIQAFRYQMERQLADFDSEFATYKAAAVREEFPNLQDAVSAIDSKLAMAREHVERLRDAPDEVVAEERDALSALFNDIQDLFQQAAKQLELLQPPPDVPDPAELPTTPPVEGGPK